MKVPTTILHVARRELRMEDADYRALLQRAAGVDSSTGIKSRRQLDDVMAEFKRLGFRKKPSARHGRAPNTLEREPQMQKIEALLAEMGAAWGYAEAIAMQQNPAGADHRIERLEWVPTHKLRGVITALVRELEKRTLLGIVDTHLSTRQKTHADVDARLMRDGIALKNWQRNPDKLRRVLLLVDAWWPA